MITDRNKLNFVTIQQRLLWFLGLILVCSGSDSNSNSNTLIYNVEATQQQQLHQQHNQPAMSLAQTQAQQSTLQQQSQQQVESNGPPPQQDVTVRNFSPRMDYNNHEWRPVGRGDPLKNDPTFDYSPPTLDRVRYWADTDKDKEKLEEVSSAIIDAKLKKANPGKNEILLLGVTGDRLRGAPVLQHAAGHSSGGMMKNAKGETPLLQPKYTSIRRSYYAHQLPTHLMPPPMQPMMPASQQQQQQQLQQQPHQQSHQQSQPQQQQQQPLHQQMLLQHMIKPVHTEYRHNMPAAAMASHTYVSSPSIATAMNAHTKPQHMSLSTHQPWMHTTSSIATVMPSQHHMKPAAAMGGQHFSHHSHDAHHQESMNYMTYTRPNMMSSTPAVMAGQQDYYSPNSIRGSAAVHKPVTSSRKPWLHDLLKKEFIKPQQKPATSPNSYHMDTPKSPHIETKYHNSYHTEAPKPLRMETNYHNSYHTERPKPTPMESNYHNSYHLETPKPQNMETIYYNSYHTEASKPPQMESHFVNSYHTDAPKPPQMESHFEPMLSPSRGISTTFAPVSFVTPPTTAATTQAAIFISSSTSPTHQTTSAPVFTHAPPSTYAPIRTTTTISPTRLLIPNTSNLAYRPTVTPMKMTTDSLFSHYNQPEKPLKGPMYLIIEGHSKVKTYGKDELDPHRPKIVPVISKREPVVRVADPNEKRGTPETFQVKHLHTKTTSAMEKPTTTTTMKPSTTKAPSSSSTNTKIPKVSTTTNKPTTTKLKTTTTLKPSKPTKPIAKKPQPTMATTTTTKPKMATKSVPKLSVTASTSTTTTTAKPKILNKDSKSPLKGADKMSPHNLNVLDNGAKPSPAYPTQPPTGMQGLLSLLGSSLDTFLHDGLTAPSASNSKEAEMKDTTTKLKPINMNRQPEIEARVSTKLQAIKAEDYEDDDNDQLRKVTTEYLPRETRQIFDYDQLPESRISEDKDNTNYEELIDGEDLNAMGFDDEYEEDDEDDETPSSSSSSSNHQQLIKRIDSLVSSAEDLDDDDDDLEDDEEFVLDALNLSRQQKSSPKRA